MNAHSDTPASTSVPYPADDWQFDHLTLVAESGNPAVNSLAALLGLNRGRRPAFPFGGAWFYQGSEARLHVIDAPQDAGAQLDHIAFRSNRPLETLLPDFDASGLSYQVRRIPGTVTAQVFVQVADNFLLELDVPEGAAAAAATDYSPRNQAE